jgi:hypothetical protein
MRIAVLSLAESIIADRSQSYLLFKEKELMFGRLKQNRYFNIKLLSTNV